MKKTIRKILPGPIAALAVALVLFVGCADRKDLNEPKTHVAGWMDRSSDQFHGGKIEAVNLISCSNCHGDDHRGGTSGVSCYRCHGGGPSGHPGGWIDTTSARFHGLAVATDGSGRCATCHGEDFRGVANNGSSCYLCHNGPSGHPSSGWLSKTNVNFHGIRASVRGLSSCAHCHGEDLKGGSSGRSCYTCHSSGPSGHPPLDEWYNPSSNRFHGVRVSQTGTGYCGGCHGEDFRGGDSEVSCYTCHNGPSGHPAQGWFSRNSENFHGLAASGRGLPACAECHGSDFHGGISGTDCHTCHSTGPSGHPARAEWLSPSSNRFHGVRVSQTGTGYCGGCHGEDFRGGFAGVGCYTCHNGPSGHPYGWLDYNAGANFHGTVIRNQGVTSCQACHGQALDGGISGVACSDCH